MKGFFTVVAAAAVVVALSVGATSGDGHSADPLALEWRLLLSDALIDDDFENMSFPQASGGQPIAQWSYSSTVPSTGRNYTIHIGSLSSGLPDAFTFQLPKGGSYMIWNP